MCRCSAPRSSTEWTVPATRSPTPSSISATADCSCRPAMTRIRSPRPTRRRRDPLGRAVLRGHRRRRRTRREGRRHDPRTRPDLRHRRPLRVDPRSVRPALDGDDARRGRLARRTRPADGRVGQGERLTHPVRPLRLAEGDLNRLRCTGRVHIRQRHVVSGCLRAHRRDQRVGAVDRAVVDLGDHHATRQSRRRGRTVSDHLGDRRPVRAGIVCRAARPAKRA